MKNLLLTSLFCLGISALNAQVCGTDQYNESIFAANPDLRLQMHEHLTRVTSGAYADDERDGNMLFASVLL